MCPAVKKQLLNLYAVLGIEPPAEIKIAGYNPASSAGGTAPVSGLDSQTKQAMATVMQSLSDLIPSLAFNSADNNGAETKAAAEALAALLSTGGQTYTVARNLSHCTLSNAAVSVAAQASYTATLAAESGYQLAQLSVTMGGADITATAYNEATGVVTIAKVTGDVVITATATEVAGDPVLSSISATLNLGLATITTDNSLDDLKQYLTVEAVYSDTSRVTLGASAYTLSGSLVVGASTITVSYGGKATDFTVTVAEASATPATLVSISAVLDTDGDKIYDFNAPDDIRTYLTVKGHYSDGSQAAVTEYALSGPMAGGADNDLTVSYGGLTATVTVPVEQSFVLKPVALPSGYTQLTHVYSATPFNSAAAYCDIGIRAEQVAYAKYGIQERHDPSSGTKGHVLSSKKTYYPYFKQSSISLMNNGNESVDSGGSTAFTWTRDTSYIIEGFPDVYVNGQKMCTVQKGSATPGEDNANLYVLTWGGGPTGAFRADIKLYFMRIYGQNHQLLRDLVPCKDSNSVPGLYDTVSGTFYTSGSGNNFGAGEEL